MIRTADVIVVGGGPAGSTCAWRLHQRGRHVVVFDRAVFPRDKVCAGWITPAVVDRLELDVGEYARGRTWQPFKGFRTARLDGGLRDIRFGRVVSYGIRRTEFDAFLLARSGARVRAGEPVHSIRRDGRMWIVNEVERAPVLIGAGGHFCPVARQLNPVPRAESVIVAQEVEFPSPSTEREDGELPELYFWPDLRGYGWRVRKDGYLNVGVGRVQASGLAAAARRFRALLVTRGRVPGDLPAQWKGHAYLLGRNSRRQVTDEGVLLVGDAAGLALAPSGEGIPTAVESGRLAAEAVIAAGARVAHDVFGRYTSELRGRFDWRPDAPEPRWWPAWAAEAAGRVLLGSRWLTAHLLLERGFLHQHRRAS